jgi:hypothetical protein
MVALFQIRRACGNNRGVVPVLVGNIYSRSVSENEKEN